MKLETAKKIVECLKDNGMEASLYEDYSGRGMYGRYTTGIVVDDPSDVAWAAGQLGMRNPGNRRDNMGMGYIIY